MINNQKVLGLITARGGSKRLPGKNLADIGGRSLIQWTVDAALEAPLIDRLIISSDDQEIIEEAEKFGCEAPFLRPDYLSGDDATSVDVALHALAQLDWHDGFMVLLQPTSPFRRAVDIEACIKACAKDDLTACVSVVAPKKPARWLLKETGDGYIAPVFPNEFFGKTDKDQQFFMPNGAVFVVRVKEFLQGKTFWPKELTFILMEEDRSIDIDQMEDLEHARYLLNCGRVT